MDAPDDRQATAPRKQLRQAIAAFPGQPFAVVDGGRFEDITVLLASEQLFARSLFLDTVDEDIRKAGPWLLKLDQQPDATDRVMSLIGDEPAAVYWSCAGGETTLWRHLRSLTMARIPSWAAQGGERPFYDGRYFPDESVFFRHYDPRVLLALLPCLDDRQFSRIIGPAEEMAFSTSIPPAMRRVIADPSWRAGRLGHLTITSAQISALTERRRKAVVDGYVERYLLHAAPEIFGDLDVERTRAFVHYSGRTGRALGIQSTSAHCRWAYLLASSNGEVLDTPGVVAFITQSGQSPDKQVAAVMRRIAEHLRS